MACCTTNTRGCCPLPPTVATPCLMDWTVAAFAAAAPGTVAIADTYGNILGSGFWVNGYSVVTAWHVVGRESLGIRVVITVAGTVPTSLDGVLTFAIPGLDLALVSVNPNLYPPGFTPLVLALSTTAVTGQEVYSISAALGHDPNTFAVGYIREASYTDTGTITDVLTSIPHYPGSSGAAVIRKADDTIIAMVQYDFAVEVDAPVVVPGSLRSPRSVSLSSVPTPGYSGGVAASLIRAFMALAGTATNGSAAVTGAYYFPGAATYPTLRENFALGMMKPAGVGEGPTSTAAVPLLAAGVQVQQLPVGTPAYGSLVYDPSVVAVPDPEGWGTAAPAYTADGQLQISSSDLQAFDAGYVRVPRAYASILLNAGTVVCNMDAHFDAALGFFDFATYANDTIVSGFQYFKFTISSSSDGAAYHYATGITAAASGWVSFASNVPGFASVIAPAQMEPVIAAPSETLYLLGVPLASSDFILPEVTPDYSVDYGQPGGPLQLSLYVELNDESLPTGVFTFQWDGYSQTTLDPVSFQVVLTGVPAELSDPVSGQMQFNYGVLPGTWAGNPWLAGSQLTSRPAADALSVSAQLIQIVDQPRMNESIYFGTAGFELTAQLPMSVTVAGSPLLSLQSRVVAPRRLPSGALPVTVGGTFAVCDADVFTYVIRSYTWDPVVLRIASLNGSPVGVSNLNTPSLTDAIIATGSIYGTQAVPKLLSAVSVAVTTPSVPLALTLAQRNAILLASVNLGAGASTVVTAPYIPATSKFDWVAAAGVYYASSLFYVQPRPNPREVYNYSSVAFTITFTGEDLINEGAGDGMIVLQLAAADSTSLLTQFADDASPSCVVLYTVGGPSLQFNADYRSGFGGALVSSSMSAMNFGANTVSGVLTYNTAAFAQRPNVLVIGHPPRAGNGPEYSPLGVVVPGFLAPCSVELGVTLVADMRSVIAPIPTSAIQFAVTTEHNVARPSFFNPVALKRG